MSHVCLEVPYSFLVSIFRLNEPDRVGGQRRLYVWLPVLRDEVAGVLAVEYFLKHTSHPSVRLA